MDCLATGLFIRRINAEFHMKLPCFFPKTS